MNFRARCCKELLFVNWRLVKLLISISLKSTLIHLLIIESAFWVVELPWLALDVDGLVLVVQVLEHVVTVASEIAPHKTQMGLGYLLPLH